MWKANRYSSYNQFTPTSLLLIIGYFEMNFTCNRYMKWKFPKLDDTLLHFRYLQSWQRFFNLNLFKTNSNSLYLQEFTFDLSYIFKWTSNNRNLSLLTMFYKYIKTQRQFAYEIVLDHLIEYCWIAVEIVAFVNRKNALLRRLTIVIPF